MAKRTYALILRDRAGSLLEVCNRLAQHQVTILRVNYNKVIDPNTFFIDAEGSQASLHAVDQEFAELGVLPGQTQVGHVELVEFSAGTPGKMAQLLEVVRRYGFNVTYCDAKAEEAKPHTARLGLYVERESDFQAFMEEVERICPARRLPYNRNQHLIDNNLFYLSFAREISERMGLDEPREHTILVNANRLVQCLENTNADPFKPFEYLRQFSVDIQSYRGEAYRKATRITPFTTAQGVKGWCIEPPAGSDTWIFECDDRLLCIDSGYRIFQRELLDVLRELFPDWDARRKELVLTHSDIDHVGGYDLFDKVYATQHVTDNFRLEHMGRPGWREARDITRAYYRIGMILSSYESPWLENFASLGTRGEEDGEPIVRCHLLDGSPATLDIEPFSFEVWEGAGGHVRGETVLIDREQRVCVSGDIFVNVHGETKPQSRFNMLAPFLMTSVDMQPDLARTERKYLFGLLDPGPWQVLGGHGSLFPYTRRAPKNPGKKSASS